MTSDHIRAKAAHLRDIASTLRRPNLAAVTRLRYLAVQLDEIAAETAALEIAAFEGARLDAADANHETLHRAMCMAGVVRQPVLPEGVADLDSWRTQARGGGPMTAQTLPARPGNGDAQAVLARLSALPAPIGFTVPADVGEAWERAREEADRSARAIARMGLYLLWLQVHLDAPAFDAGLDAHRIAPAQAGHAMRIGQLLLHAETPVARERLLDLHPDQTSVLARLDPEDIASAIEQGELDLDAAAAMTPAMLRREVRRLTAARDLAAARLADERLDKERLLAESDAPRATEGMPASLVRLRGEATAFAEAARIDLAALARSAERFLDAPDLGTHRAEREPHLRAGARAAMLNAEAALAEAHAVVVQLRETLLAWLPEGEWTSADQPAPLTLDEARRIRRWRDVHVERLDAAATARETARIARGEVRRGPGRPRKVRGAR